MIIISIKAGEWLRLIVLSFVRSKKGSESNGKKIVKKMILNDQLRSYYSIAIKTYMD
jgi:hypothetical protein